MKFSRKTKVLVVWFLACVFLGAGLPIDAADAQSARRTRPANRRITLNFVNSNIQDIIGLMAELTGRQFVLGEGVKGKISLVSGRSVDVDEAYQMFKAQLAQKGYQSVERGNVTQIVQEGQSAHMNPQKPLEISTPQSQTTLKFNFQDADINQLIQYIAKTTNKNFIVDNRVRGKITVISPKELTPEEAYKVFESVLEVHGFTTVEAGPITKIVSAPEARSKSIETLMKDDIRDPEDKVVTQLIPLKYAEPNDIKRLFGPFISKSAAMVAYEPTNTLIVTDMYSNIRRLLEILKEIDVMGVGQNITILSLEYADATKMVKTLTTVFQQKRTRRRTQKGDTQVTEDPVKFVADERTNTIIMIASEDDTDRIRKLVRRLDMEVPRGKEKIRVYYLENASAEELADVLQSLSQKATKTTNAKGAKKVTQPIVSEGVKITADKATNSLIIMAEKDDYQVLEDVIRKLDIPRSMVYIECLIMEVNVDKNFNLGTEWMVMSEVSHDGKQGGVGGGFSGSGDTGYSGITGLIAPSNAAGVGTLPPGFSLGVFSEAVTIGNVIFPNLAAMIDAYRKDKNVNILSTPQILTTDNEEATIYTGKNVPYLTKSGSSTVESYNTYEYKDVGITLKITPQISKDRQIRLKISQESTKLDDLASTGENRPTTLKRTIDTTIIVDDKNTIAIGGLIEDSFSNTENKVPCLSSIPFLGWAFRSLSQSREKTNLFVFLTPHVVRNEEEAKMLMQEKQEHLNIMEQEQEIKLYDTIGILPKPKVIDLKGNQEKIEEAVEGADQWKDDE